MHIQYAHHGHRRQVLLEERIGESSFAAQEGEEGVVLVRISGIVLLVFKG
jgi:hypothetical protein